jgi:uncharacterized protein (TIGR00296 family)
MSPRDDSEQLEATTTNPVVLVEATAEMCHYCFDLLVHELKFNTTNDDKRKSKQLKPPSPDFLLTLPKSAQTPLFITWEKLQLAATASKPSQSYGLRGCIGTLSPRPLTSAIGEYALTAALRDRRFDPIRHDEIPHLRVGVSLLVKYEQCDHVHDWEVGLHGILINFTLDDGVSASASSTTADYSATYLPEVAKEQW